MIVASARYTQNLTRFIEITGAANVGWTEAGCIEGNDPYPGLNTLRAYTIGRHDYRRYPVRMDRFYKPIWVEEAEEMYAQLDVTWGRILRCQEEDFEIENLEAIAADVDKKKIAPLDVFEDGTFEFDVSLSSKDRAKMQRQWHEMMAMAKNAGS